MLRKLHRIIRQNDHRSKHDDMEAHRLYDDLPDDTDEQCGLCWPFKHDDARHHEKEEQT